MTTRDVPFVPVDERVTIAPLDERGCHQVLVNYGFKDEVNLPLALRSCAARGPAIDPHRVSYFLSHATVAATGGKGMRVWRETWFATMSHNISNVAAYMKLPANRVIELGSRVQI